MLRQDFGRLQRLIDEIRVDYDYISPQGTKKFGSNDLDLRDVRVSAVVQKTPLLSRPALNFHWWQGPTDPICRRGCCPIFRLGSRRLSGRVETAGHGPGRWIRRFASASIPISRSRMTQKLCATRATVFVLSLSPSRNQGGIVHHADCILLNSTCCPPPASCWTPMPDTESSWCSCSSDFAGRAQMHGNTAWWRHRAGNTAAVRGKSVPSARHP